MNNFGDKGALAKSISEKQLHRTVCNTQSVAVTEDSCMFLYNPMFSQVFISLSLSTRIPKQRA